MKASVPFGFEAGSGAPVHIDLSDSPHLLFSGLTRGSGKTTAMLGLLERLGARALAFEVKPWRGRKEPDWLGHGTEVPVLMPGLVDEVSLKEMLEDLGRMGLKGEFPDIVQACQGARNLEEVLANVRRRLNPPAAPEETKAKPQRPLRMDNRTRRGLLTLENLLQSLVNEIREAHPVLTLKLHPGINVMDLSELSDAFKQLVVGAAADYLFRRETNVVLCLDEAHLFAPENEHSAARPALVNVAKLGASSGLWLWCATQAITSLNKQVLKQTGTFIMGRQFEINECERTIEQIPLSDRQKPKPYQVQQLKVGYFYVASTAGNTEAYAWPAWLSDAKTAQMWARMRKTPPPMSVEAQHQMRRC